MQRYYITLGAPTTAGGKVISANHCDTLDGIPMALEGDRCWCPACDAEGIIVLDGPRLSETFDGHEFALSDDLCLCKCHPPPRLVSAQTFACQLIDSALHAALAGAAAHDAAQRNASAGSAPASDGIPFVLLDPRSQEPYPHRPYRLRLREGVIEGITDAHGATRPLSAAWGDAALERRRARRGARVERRRRRQRRLTPLPLPNRPRMPPARMPVPTTYAPGKPHPHFAKHQFHGVRVYGNYQRVQECRAHHYVGPCATVKQGIAAYVLSPEHLWATFQTEAEDLLKENGRFVGDPKERNRRINAAYARLWLADNRFQWAGLAAFASKQVGCGLLHATDVVERNRREREQIQRSFAQAGVGGAEAATLMQMGTEIGAHQMTKRLGYGNMHLFLDIYPLYRFFMERGWEEFHRYLPNRKNDKYPVHWEVDRATLPFGEPFREIIEGFGFINAGRLHDGVVLLARHEQINILQKLMYEDKMMQLLLGMNQFAWATGFPSGDYQEIQLTLSAECRAKTGMTSWFSREKCAKLWIVAERMRFVYAAAERFDRLLNSSERRRVEESIHAVAEGGGVS